MRILRYAACMDQDFNSVVSNRSLSGISVLRSCNQSLLFGVESADVGTFLSMSAALVLVGLLASYLPARRASSVDPIESLRAD